jgi:hypothetical protein
MTQSRKMSLIEAVTNVAVGYGLAVITQIIVFPWFGIKAALGEHLAIGFAFVGVSLARSYLLRRFFERIRVASHSGGHDEHGESAPHHR